MSRTEARIHLRFTFHRPGHLAKNSAYFFMFLLFFLLPRTKTCWQTCQTYRRTLVLSLCNTFSSSKWDLRSETLFNEGESSPHIYCSRWKKISSISPKMAADVGSMFQYWKKFDLRRLQVSAFLTSLARFCSGAPRFPSPACVAAFRATAEPKAGGVCIDSY